MGLFGKLVFVGLNFMIGDREFVVGQLVFAISTEGGSDKLGATLMGLHESVKAQ